MTRTVTSLLWVPCFFVFTSACTTASPVAEKKAAPRFFPLPPGCEGTWEEISLSSSRSSEKPSGTMSEKKLKAFVHQPSATTEIATIVIHGLRREADRYFNHFMAATEAAIDCRSHLVIAPRFPEESDRQFLSWNGAWKAGGASRDDSKTSAFVAIDEILSTFLDTNQFPSLRQVNVVGHSAGAQFVQRYAFFNDIDRQGFLREGVPLHYVVANPSSYLYLDPRRFDPESGLFSLPSDDAKAGCPTYNSYKHGLEDIVPELQRYKSGSEAITRFSTRQVLYALGKSDNDVDHADLARTCADNFQGTERFSRGMAYYSHLQKIYGDDIGRTQKLHVVAGVGHELRKVFEDPVVRAFLIP